MHGFAAMGEGAAVGCVVTRLILRRGASRDVTWSGHGQEVLPVAGAGDMFCGQGIVGGQWQATPLTVNDVGLALLLVYVPVKPIVTDAFAASDALYGSFVAVTASPVCV